MGLFNRKKKEQEIVAAEQAQKKEAHDDCVKRQKEAHKDLRWPVNLPVSQMRAADGTVLKPDDPLTDARKEELGQLVYEPKLDPEALAELPLHELMFLKASYPAYNRYSALDHFEENDRVLYNELLRRVQEAETYYVLFDLATGAVDAAKKTQYLYPFLFDGFAQLYLSEEHAKKAAELFGKLYRRVTVLKVQGCGSDKESRFFTRLFNLGIDRIMVDNGWYRWAIQRDEVVAPPFFLNEDKRPLEAPALVRAMLEFKGEASWPVKYDNHQKRIDAFRSFMEQQTIASRFIIPVQFLDKESGKPLEASEVRTRMGTAEKNIIVNVLPLRVKAKDGKTAEFLPLYTDQEEFAKSSFPGTAAPNIMNYREIVNVIGRIPAEQMTGIVINNLGEGIVFPRQEFLDLSQKYAPKTQE